MTFGHSWVVLRCDDTVRSTETRKTGCAIRDWVIVVEAVVAGYRR